MPTVVHLVNSQPDIDACIFGYVYEDANANGVLDEPDFQTGSYDVQILRETGGILENWQCYVGPDLFNFSYVPLNENLRAQFTIGGDWFFSTPNTDPACNLDPWLTRYNALETYESLEVNGQSVVRGTSEDIVFQTVTGVVLPVDDAHKFDIGIYRKASFSDCLYHDLNQNGVQDAGESGLAGVVVTLFGVDGYGQSVERSTTTDALGAYHFDDLMPASYQLLVNTPGWTVTEGNLLWNWTGASDGIQFQMPVLNSGDVKDNGGTGLYTDTRIEGIVWYDDNKDGLQNDEWFALGQNSVVWLRQMDGTPVASTELDSNNQYAFTQLPLDSYYVDFSQVVALPGTLWAVRHSDPLQPDLDSDVDPLTSRTGEVILSTTSPSALHQDAGLDAAAPDAFNQELWLKAGTSATPAHLDGDLRPFLFDLTGLPITWTQLSDVAIGTLTWNGDGTYTYDAPEGLIADVQFSYQVSNRFGESPEYVVQIHVIDEAPVVGDAEFWIHSNQNLTTDIECLQQVAFDSDDFGVLTISQVVGSQFDPLHGTVQVNDGGSFTYEPTSGFSGDDRFYVRAFDGVLYSDPACITVHVLNAAPVAADDTYYLSTTTDIAGSFSVLTNDSDSDEDLLTAILVSGPSFASNFQLASDGTFAYSFATPLPAEFTGQDSFTYRVFDGASYSDPVTVTIVHSEIPVAEDDSYYIPESGTRVVDAESGLLANDHNPFQREMTVELVEGIDPGVGTLTLAPNGSFTFVAEPDFLGIASFRYLAVDLTGRSVQRVVSLIRAAIELQNQQLRDTVTLRDAEFRYGAGPNTGAALTTPPPLISDRMVPGAPNAMGQPLATYAPPHWLDRNQNGTIDANADPSQSDHQCPVVIPSGQRMTVNANFVLSDPAWWRNFATRRPNGDLRIRIRARNEAMPEFSLGFARETYGYITVVNQQTRISTRNNVYLDSAFSASRARYFPSFTLRWEFSPDDGATWIAPLTAVTSTNRVYVTYATPGPMARNCESMYYIGCTAVEASTVMGPLNRDQVIAAAFKPFEDRNVRTVDNRQLCYYGSWATRVQDVPRLLDGADGVCDSWSRLFVNILNTQGLTAYTYGNSIQALRPPAGEFLLVNNWQFGAANIPVNDPNTAGYSHFNVPVVNESILIPGPPILAASSAANAYQWRGGASPVPVVVDLAGVAGQGQPNPHSMFNVHIVVQLLNDPARIFDPSYGTIHLAANNRTAVQIFEDAAIAGYVKQFSVVEGDWGIDLDGNGIITPRVQGQVNTTVTVFVFRQRQAGQYAIRSLPYQS